MTKNEMTVEMQRLKNQRIYEYMELGKHALTLVCVAGCVWLIFEGLKPMIVNQSPLAIEALSKVIDKLKLGSVIGYIWGGLATAAFVTERKGKKRAIKEKNRQQTIAEKDDANRTSSGLTDTGETPSRRGSK